MCNAEQLNYSPWIEKFQLWRKITDSESNYFREASAEGWPHRDVWDSRRTSTTVISSHLSQVTTTWEVINWSCISIITGWMFTSSSSPRESSVRGIVFHRLLWMRHPWIHWNGNWTISGRIWATNKLCFSSPLFIKFKFKYSVYQFYFIFLL